MLIERLAQYRNFVLYDTSLSEDEADYKKPLRLVDGKGASSTNPSDWCSYDEAVQVTANYPKFGIGFVLTNTPFSCIDLDSYKTTDEKILNLHRQIHDTFNSYSELSPRGGVHIWIEGEAETKKVSSHHLEVYSSERYITLTGKPLNLVPIAKRQELLDNLIHDIDTLRGKQSNQATTDFNKPQTIADEKVIELAFNAANGDMFKELYQGNWKLYFSSQSEGDLALCNIIAYFTDNKEQVGRIYWNSPLFLNSPKKKRKAKPDYLFDEKYGIVTKSFDQKVAPLTPEALSALRKKNLQQYEVIQQEKRELEAEQNQAWDFPPGFVGEIAKFIYDAAPSPLYEVAIGGAIAYYAGLMGRAFNVSGFGLNQYVMVLAPTGSGKDAAKTGIFKIQNAIKPDMQQVTNSIGPEHIGSAIGLIKRLVESPCCLSILGEVGLWLQGICSKKASPNDVGIRRLLLRLYSSSGKDNEIGTGAYSDKANNETNVESPSYSILGESTQIAFYKSITEETISDGFIPRLTILEYSGKLPQYNEAHNSVKFPAHMVNKLMGQLKRAWEYEKLNQIKELQFDSESNVYRKQLAKYCRDKVEEHNQAEESHLSEIWTRVSAKVLKLAGLLAVGVNFDNPIITMNEMKYAEMVITKGNDVLTRRFETGDIGEESLGNAQRKAVCNTILNIVGVQWSPKLEDSYSFTKEHFDQQIIPYTYIQKKTKGLACFRHANHPAFELKNVLKEFVDAGALQETKWQSGVQIAVGYRITNINSVKVIGK